MLRERLKLPSFRALVAVGACIPGFALWGAGCSVEEVTVVEGQRDRIVITDVTGGTWDITTAAYDYGMDPEKFEHGLGRNAIVPLDSPPMLSPGDRGYPSDDASFLVVGTAVGDDIRAYGKLDIIRNEVVDVVIGGAHLAVTYWPLADAAAVYSRTLDGEVLTIAASGWTYENLFVLHDRESQSLWYDFGDGGLTCVAGKHEGHRLEETLSGFVPWHQWKSDYPLTKVLPSRNGRPE